MKPVLTIGKEIMYIKKNECESLNLTNEELIDLVERGLAYHGRKELEMPAKIGIHPKEDAFIHAMPAYLPKENVSGIKWVSGFPKNKEYGLPHIYGLLILNDPMTGFPIAIMDGTWITTVRTVAVTMAAIRKLGNLESDTFGMIGCGELGKKHVEFVSTVLPKLSKIYIHDVNEEAMNELIQHVQPKITATIIKASMEEVVKNSLIVASATLFSPPRPQIKDDWTRKGQTILLCDSHALYEDITIKKADKYVIDSIEQGREFEKMGYYPFGLPNTNFELGEVIAGFKKGREDKQELIISNNIGMALEDMMVAKEIYRRAIEAGIGFKLSL